jgi:hypothetical protein
MHMGGGRKEGRESVLIEDLKNGSNIFTWPRLSCTYTPNVCMRVHVRIQLLSNKKCVHNGCTCGTAKILILLQSEDA